VPKSAESASDEFPSSFVRTRQIPLTADVFYGRPLISSWCAATRNVLQLIISCIESRATKVELVFLVSRF